MNINKEYKYFIINTDSAVIIGGYEFRADALDLASELNENEVFPLYKVYKAKYIRTHYDINAFNSFNWGNV